MGLLDNVKDLVRSKKLFLNKYVFVSLLFLTWLTFFDNYSLIQQSKLSNTISELEADKSNYEDKLAEAVAQREEILNDKEKFARENHMFHKDDEKVIIIPPKEKK